MNKVVILRSSSIYEDSRATKWATELTTLGYEVEALCWDRKREHKVEEEFLLPNSKTIKVKFFIKQCSYGGGIKNLFKMFKFHSWLKKELKKYPNGTIVHACDYDTAKPIYKLCGKKIKLVYDIFDFYAETHTLPFGLSYFVKKQEIKIINNADATVICTEQRREQIKSSNPKKLYVIHNTPNLNYDVKEINPNNRLKICYIGSLGYDRLLLEIFEEIKNYPQYDFLFGGLGTYAEDIEELSKKYDNVSYLGKMKYSDVLKHEQTSDVLFATYNPMIKNHKYSAPNKFYEAGCLAKPIIVCKNTGVDKLVKDYNTGLIVEYSANDFFDKLSLLDKDRELYKTLAQNGRKAYLENFSWDKMSERIKEIYENL